MSVNGGRCATTWLPCHSFTPRGNYDYMLPGTLAVTVARAGGRDAWVLIQFYKLVIGRLGRIGDRFSWDRTSSDPRDRWMSASEIYCWDDYLTVVSSIPSTTTVGDPASIAELTGRTVSPVAA